MHSTESTQKLLAAFLKVQAETKTLVKNKKNPHTGSMYADLEAVANVADAVLTKHGLTLLTLPASNLSHSSGIYSIGVLCMLAHPESGEWITQEFLMPAPIEKRWKKDPSTKKETDVIAQEGVTAQGAGSVLTYMRRYAIVTILNLRAEDDDDGNSASGRAYEAPEKPKSPQERIHDLKEHAVNVLGWTHADMDEWIAANGGKLTGTNVKAFGDRFSKAKGEV